MIENKLRTELQKTMRIAEKKNKIVLKKPRTLKAFILNEEMKPGKFCCVFTCSNFYNVCFSNNDKTYKGCSNMNPASFIIFFTNMLRQNVIRFYIELYAVFRLAPDIKNAVYLSSFSPLIVGRSKRIAHLQTQCVEHNRRA